MAKVVITIKVMPVSPSANLKNIEKNVSEKIKKFGGDLGKVELEPVAFGLKAIKFIFVLDESKGSTEALEENIKKINEVNSVEVVDVRRAIG